MFPLFLIYFFDFISSTVSWQLTGFSGFTAATPEAAGYSVVEHGRTFHLTPGQLWLGRIQSVIFIVCFVAWFVARVTFYIRETLDVISLPPKNRTSETPLRRLAPSVCRKSRLSLSHRPGVAHLQR